MRRIIVLLALVAGMVAATAGPASAHTATVSADCEGWTVTLSSFTKYIDHDITITVDGTNVSNPATFNGSQTLSGPLPAGAADDGSVTVTASWKHILQPVVQTQTFEVYCSTPTETPPPPPPCEQTEAGCETPTPPPPPTSPEVFIFSSCDGTFIRGIGSGILNVTIDGVLTQYTYSGTDIQLGQLADGTVVVAGFQGGDTKTLTVDNGECSVTPTPSPTPPPPTTPPWHPTWTPAPQPVQPNGPPANTAFTGAPSNTVPLAGAAGVFLITGIAAILRSRKLFGR